MQAHQILTTELEGNPGILPFKLGRLKFQKTDHVFLHYVELDKIKDSITNVETYLGRYIEYIKSSDPSYFSDTSFLTNLLLANILETIHTKFNLLYKRFRNKRGLVDGLGAIIKGITGNLDHDDALYYNNAIKILQKNQETLKDKFNSGISLNEHVLQNLNITLSTIVTNEYKIHVKLDEIVREINMTNFRLKDYVKINGLYNLLKLNLQNILSYVISLEDAISFAKLGITHHSVISSQNINYMISTLSKIYDKSELIIDENTEIRDYIDIIESGSYYTDNTVVFILKFPIMHSKTYIYYHLFPTPTYNNTILIPQKPYLAISNESHYYMDTECKRFHQVFYCHEGELTVTTEAKDCINLLILKQEISTACIFTHFKAKTELLQKLDDTHYIVTCTERTRVQFICDQETYKSLHGTYLIEVPESCSFITKSHVVRNYKNQIRGVPIQLLSFQFTDVKIRNNDQPLLLDNVQLDQVYKLESLMEKEKILDFDALTDNSYHFWIIPLYIVIMVTAIVYIIHWILVKRKMKKNQETPDIEAERPTGQPFFS